MDKKSKNTLIISIIALALVLIGVTYAYFSARITGLESASTISLTAGRMGIHYSEGDENVIMNNIYPREEAWITKTFTLTGWNTTDQQMLYDVGLNVTTNTFTNDYLTYDLRLVSSTNGTPIATSTNNPINGTGFVKFGKGIFTNADGDTHNYELKIYFKDNGLDQNDAQEAVFNAKISVIEAFYAPDGWNSAPSDSLIAGIRSNNYAPALASQHTIPGVEHPASGPVTESKDYLCAENDPDCVVYYYLTEEDFSSDENEMEGNYNDVYSNLPGKYIAVPEPPYLKYVLEATPTTVTTTNNGRVLTLEKNLLLATEDDYGISYYYRGLADNNFVVFANMCWRIVRIDGAGNIKLTLYNYNPTDANNPCASNLDGDTMAFARSSASDPSSYRSEYNNSSDSNTYVGFKYSSSPNGSDYLTTHANNNDSTILTFLKNWYDRVFTTNQKNMLADVIWCNDKRIVSDTTFNSYYFNNVLGTGAATDSTYYKALQRLYPNNGTRSMIMYGAAPSLKCGENKNDNFISKFTASTLTDGGYGNGALDGYKIGLLTADEQTFAGIVNLYDWEPLSYLLENTYETTSGSWWTMTPGHFRGQSHVYYVLAEGSFSIQTDYDSSVLDQFAVRPAVSLKSDVTTTGSGTQSNPFVVVESR